MNEMQQKVHAFLLKHLGASPSGWPNKTGTLNKWLLVREEFEELTAALDIDPNGIEPEQGLSVDDPMAVDAICDLLYVIFNLCEELELDIEPFFNEVHRSNMTKVPAALSSNMKVQKGPDWEAPRIAEMLEEYKRRPNTPLAASTTLQDQCTVCGGKGTVTATYVTTKGKRLDMTARCPDLCDNGTVGV